MFKFTPMDEVDGAESIRVPYWEDARADIAPYYSLRDWTLADMMKAVEVEFSKLGAGIRRFRYGVFDIEEQERHGFQIEFVWKGVKGRIVVAGLPMRGEITDTKLLKVKLQALAVTRDWIKAAVTAQVFSPGAHPLVPHLILPDGTTMAENVAKVTRLPNLPGGTIALIGEVIE